MSMEAEHDIRELLIAVIARLARGARHAAAGAQSPIPGSALFLAQKWARDAGERPADAAHLRRYAEMARSDEGFARYLDEFVLRSRAAA